MIEDKEEYVKEYVSCELEVNLDLVNNILSSFTGEQPEDRRALTSDIIQNGLHLSESLTVIRLRSSPSVVIP
jgi:hypothetical protein